MTDCVDDRLDGCDAMDRDEPEPPVMEGGAELLFGSYSVLSPGVEIVLEGRPVSAPVGD